MTTRTNPPTQDEVLGYFESLSNWGRWGEDDQRGTLNHITPDARSAPRTVRHGISVSCAWESRSDPAGFDDRPSRLRAAPDAGQRERHDGRLPRGRPLGFLGGDVQLHLPRRRAHSRRLAPTSSGTARCTTAGRRPRRPTDGRVGGCHRGRRRHGHARGAARHPSARGVEWLEPGDAVVPEDLDAAEQPSGVTVEPGDAVLLAPATAVPP